MFDAAIAAAAEAAPQTKTSAPDLVPGLVVHIDGDYIAYYAAGNDNTTPGQARLNAASLVDYCRAMTGATDAVVHSTVPGCAKGERYLIAQTRPYQGNRSGGSKPKNHAYLQNWLLHYDGKAFRTKVWTEREADDGICFAAYWARGRKPGYAAIASRDKDLRMIPGRHLDLETGKITDVPFDTYSIVGENGKIYGFKWFWLQMLMGDQADNIQGIYRMGEKGALAALEPANDVIDAMNIVRGIYADDDKFCEHAALLWMRTTQTAPVSDYVTHIAPIMDSDLRAAVKRLEDRVTTQRQALSELGSSRNPAAPAASPTE